MDVYINDATTPVTSDTNGYIEIPREGLNTLHVYKKGFTTLSIVNKNWQNVRSEKISLTGDLVETYGRIIGTITSSRPMDTPAEIISSDGYSINKIEQSLANTESAYRIPALRGQNSLAVLPAQLDIHPNDMFFGLERKINVVAEEITNVDIALVPGGKQFNVNVTDGVPDGTLFFGYQIQGDTASKELLAQNYESVDGSETSQLVTTPVGDVLANSSVVLSAGSLGAELNSPLAYREIERFFTSPDELNTAASDQHFALQDLGLTDIKPQSGESSVDTRPVFSWTVSPENAGYVQLYLYPNDFELSAPIWQAQVFPPVSSVHYPAFLDELPVYFFVFDILAVKETYAEGRLTERILSGKSASILTGTDTTTTASPLRTVSKVRRQWQSTLERLRRK